MADDTTTPQPAEDSRSRSAITVRQQAEREVREMSARGHTAHDIAVEMAVEVIVLNKRIARLTSGEGVR